MSHLIRRLFPSMFHRRLVLLAGLVVLAMAALAGQISNLTLVNGQMWKERAEASLQTTRLIPTVRGAILDRKGRVLAQDRPAFDVAVDYRVLNGEWQYRQARRDVFRANRDTWRKLSEPQRKELIEQAQKPYDLQADAMWQTLADLGRIDPAELQQRRDRIKAKVERIATDVMLRRQRSRSAELDQVVPLAQVARPIAEQVAPHTVLPNIDDAGRAMLERLVAQARRGDENVPPVWKFVWIERSRERQYPLGDMHLMLDRSTFPSPIRVMTPTEVQVHGVAVHLIGDLRNVWDEDVNGVRDPATGQVIKPGRPFRRTQETGQTVIDLGGYLPGDQVGRWGIEQSMEAVLRGQRGRVVEHLDTMQQDRTEPVAGNAAQLSIDIALQARIQAILDPAMGLMQVQPWQRKFAADDLPTMPQLGQRLNGSAVVLDVATGQVLAAVSQPGFTMEQLKDEPQTVWDDLVDRPFLNRPVSLPYEPGSTIKPILLAAAMTDHKYAMGEAIECTGHLDAGHPGRYRCWIYSHYGGLTHKALEAPEALARSCNIFFYTLGRRLGAPRVTWWYGQFGLGLTHNCGIPQEVAGDLPDLANVGRRNAGFEDADAVQMGIGQGPVRWTVIQAASAYAALARGGYYLSPTFVASVNGLPAAQESRDLHLDPRGVALALRGLDEAANNPSYGTTHHLSILNREPIFTVPGVHVRAKSGTATAAPLRQPIDDNNDGYPDRYGPPIRTGDHGWVIAMVQREGEEQPRYIVAAVVEFGGSGGAAAGPIVNQILHALRAEGYL